MTNDAVFPNNTNCSNRVLVADDDSRVRDFLEVILKGMGFAPLMAPNGAEATRYCKIYRFVLAAIDFQMPGMSGLTVCETLKAVQPECKVILMSGAREAAVLAKAADAFLTKPFTPEEFLAVVNRLFR